MQSGDTLGPYELVEPLGAGGMGQVWLAEDPRLGRRVAVKVLPPEFADDPDRLQRFELEAKAAAALSHPHVAAVFDVGREDGTPYIVQELLDGESLGDALVAGAIHPSRALTIAAEAASGLAAAHAAGVVHRDLKPDNVFISPAGRAKVLDFGLAKEAAPRRRGSASGSGAGSASGRGDAAGAGHSDMRGPNATSELSRTPTSPTPTGERMVGSVGYMSPEQIEGRAVDHRTDLFALGCVLYEMLAGSHPFRGRSVHQTVDRVLHDDPDPLMERASGLPPLVYWIVDKCLAKDAADRYQGAEDLEVDLRTAARQVKSGVRAPTAVAAASPRAVVVAVAALVVTALAAAWVGSRLAAPPPRAGSSLARYFVTLPAGSQLALTNLRPLALSPDGERLAYVVVDAGGSQLHVRDRDRFEGAPVAGTEGGNNPVFSPDGRWLGFFSGGKLRKISLTGGAPTVLADVSFQPQGVSWGDDGRVVFSSSAGSGLWRVAADGGDAEELTVLDVGAGEVSHRWPHALPGGRGVLFVIGRAADPSFDDATIAVYSGSTGDVTPLLEGTDPHYLPTGHLLFARAGALLVAPFDIDRLAVTGPATSVVDGVAMRRLSGAAYYAVAPSGTLAYVSGLGVASRSLVWVDESGRETPAGLDRRAFETPRLSPDGRRVAVTIQPEGGNPDVWVQDLERGTTTRLTYEGTNGFPVWSPDGRRVAFTSNRDGAFNIYAMAADGSDSAAALLAPGNARYPDAWAPSGELAYTEDDPETASDLWVIRVGEASEPPQEVARRPFVESSGAFSPDGRWLAYVSDESGRDEVFVRGWGEAAGRWQVSTSGGSEPRWSQDGRRIYYRNAGRVLVVAVRPEGELRVGAPVELFGGPYVVGAGSANYDVAADGRLLMVRSEAASAPTLVSVVEGWFEELRATLPDGER